MQRVCVEKMSKPRPLATKMFSEVFHDFHVVDLLPTGFQCAPLGVLLQGQSRWRRQDSVPRATCLVCFPGNRDQLVYFDVRVDYFLFNLQTFVYVVCRGGNLSSVYSTVLLSIFFSLILREPFRLREQCEKSFSQIWVHLERKTLNRMHK